MTLDMLAVADAVSDQDLLARLDALASRERSASADLVAHLAALDARPALYAAKGYGSLFSYCTQALRLSEDATCNRIAAAKACRRFPVLLELLASGSLSLTSIRMLGPHLTAENLSPVLERASRRTLREIDALIAELAPKPDVATSVRKLPEPLSFTVSATPQAVSPGAEAGAVKVLPVVPSAARAVVKATAPRRYRVEFTMQEEMHARLRRVEQLLRREIPSGDAAAIFDRALKILERDLERTKLGAAANPRADPPIRRETDEPRPPSPPPSRHVPNAVKREVWRRDDGQCAFVSAEGRRCSERSFLELHHVRAYAKGGPATVENIALRCRRHNQYEAELEFGPRARTNTLAWLIRTPAPGC
jgi:5-methylcytosine-specific restriction endonuclease McrA